MTCDPGDGDAPQFRIWESDEESFVLAFVQILFRLLAGNETDEGPEMETTHWFCSVTKCWSNKVTQTYPKDA